MLKIKLFIIMFYIGINICFGDRQIIYGTYEIFNADIPNKVTDSDTIIWKYYNQNENKILEGVLISLIIIILYSPKQSHPQH